ncbi:MAG: hypothetical protein AAF804_04650 [Bacteroidota bacterium]
MYKILGYLGLFMSAFFVAAGLFIAFTQFLGPPPAVFKWEMTYFNDHPEVFNYIVGALLVAYGLFRFFRSVKIIRTMNQ